MHELSGDEVKEVQRTGMNGALRFKLISSARVIY